LPFRIVAFEEPRLNRSWRERNRAMNDEDEFILDTEEEQRLVYGFLTGWEVVVFELADEEDPAD
jgi:hypothetical protein